MPPEEKYRISDKNPGFFDSLFGSDRHEKEIRDSEDNVVGSIRDKPQSLFDSLAGINRGEKEIRDSTGNVVGSIQDKSPGLFDSFAGINHHEKQVLDSKNHPIGSIRDRPPGIIDSFVGIDRHEKEVRDSEGNTIGSIEDKPPGLFDSIAGIDRHEKDLIVNVRARGTDLGNSSEYPEFFPSVQSQGQGSYGIAVVLVVILLGILVSVENYLNTETPSNATRSFERLPPDWKPGGDPQHMPVALRGVLDKEYPGWTFPLVFSGDLQNCRQTRADFFPALVWGDFDGDGVLDYGVAIEYHKKTNTLAFLARGSGFERFVLKPSGWNILDVEMRGATLPRVSEDARGDLVQMGTMRSTTDTLIGIHCQSSSVAFMYTKGSFQHFFMSD